MVTITEVIAFVVAFILVCGALASRWSTDSHRHGSAALVLAILLSLPPWRHDASESRQKRIALLAPVADAIVAVTSNKSEQAFLITQAYAETRLARYVLEDRCADGPPGMRCDNGRARGPWQVHRGGCRGAWNEASTPDKRLEAGAKCALRGYRQGRRRCKGAMPGAFAAQWSWRMKRGVDWCAQPWAVKRAAKWLEIRRKM